LNLIASFGHREKRAFVGCVAVLCALAGGCEIGKVSPVRSVPAPVVTARNVKSIGAKWCNGGLLCEDRKQLAGYRVPWICSHRQHRKYLARCSMRHLQWQHLVEFFTSRYADVTVDDDTIRIVGRRSVTASAPVTRTAEMLGMQQASLVVQRLPNAIEITVLRGDADGSQRPGAR
jgi:hypothetical protein